MDEITKTPSVVVVNLSNGDAALFLGGELLLSVEEHRSGVYGLSPVELGKKIADAFRTAYQEYSFDVPTDPDWNWDDVMELLPAEPEGSHQAAGPDQSADEPANEATTLQRAQEAFWSVIVAAHPDAVSGDLPPETEVMLENAMTTAMDTWVSFNVPDVAVGQIDMGATFRNSETGELVAVSDVQGQEVRYYPHGGGFQRCTSLSIFLKSFEAIDISLEGFVPALFEVADGPYAVPGYHKPSDRWNGWACPHFTKQGADFLVGKIGGMSYDAYRDIYVVGDPDFDEPETFGPVEIEVAGKKVKTYPIGAWSWVWVAYKNRSELPESSEVPKIEV